MSKTVKFAGSYDGELCVPAMFAGATKKQNVNVVMAHSMVTAPNRMADALIAGGQFTLVEDHGPDLSLGAQPSETSEPGGDEGPGNAPAGGEGSGTAETSGGEAAGSESGSTDSGDGAAESTGTDGTEGTEASTETPAVSDTPTKGPKTRR